MQKHFNRSESEIRWYKGKYKVRIIQRSNVGVKGKHLIRNVLVEALEWVTLKSVDGKVEAFRGRGERFTTVPRLLWRHPRK